MAIFSDDFTTNTLDEYDITQGGSRAGAGNVRWDSSGELLDVHAPNNVTLFLSRDDVAFPESGRVHMEFVVHGDYHVTDEVGVRWRQDEDNWLDWRGTGDGSGSQFASSYGDQVRAVLGGGTVAHERRVPGTVGPGPDVRTLEATWNPSGMAVAIDGEEATSVDVDLSDFSPSTISFLVNQGDVDLHSVEVMEGDGGAERVEAKATTLTLLPGYNENSRDPDGDELNSAIPDLPILDESFIADDRLDLPLRLDDAIGAMRDDFPEYPGQEFKAYRLMNQIELSFETEDGKTISDWSTAQIRINDEEDPISPDGEWQPSYILVEGESEHGEDNPVRRLIESPDYDWYNGREKLLGDPRGWHDEVLEIDVNEVEVEGFEGVRASIIRGARDSFVVEMRRRFLDMDDWGLTTRSELGMDLLGWVGVIEGPPYFYTFIEFVVLADGSSFTRVWDASPYPKHFLYVDNLQVDDNEFDEGTDWTKHDGPLTNLRFKQTAEEHRFGKTPFAPNVGRKYEREFIRSYLRPHGDQTPAAGPHPVMKDVQEGQTLTENEILEHDEFSDPLFPWGS